MIQGARSPSTPRRSARPRTAGSTCCGAGWGYRMIEVQREQQREDVVRDRAEHLGEPHHRAVQPRPPPSGAVDAGADAHREEDDHGTEGQRERAGNREKISSLTSRSVRNEKPRQGAEHSLTKPPLTISRPTNTPLKYSVNCSGSGWSSPMLCRMSAQPLRACSLVAGHIDRAGSDGPDEEEQERRDQGHQDDADGHRGTTGDVESHAGSSTRLRWALVVGARDSATTAVDAPTGGLSATYWSTQMSSRNGMPLFGSSTTLCTFVPKTKLPLSQ